MTLIISLLELRVFVNSVEAASNGYMKSIDRN